MVPDGRLSLHHDVLADAELFVLVSLGRQMNAMPLVRTGIGDHPLLLRGEVTNDVAVAEGTLLKVAKYSSTNSQNSF